jgi:hypothetical protein
MRTGIYLLTATLIILALVGTAPNITFADDDISYITKEKLKAMLNDRNFTLIDVRFPRNWEKSKHKIKGAEREDPHDVSGWAGKYAKDHMIVLYCD